MLDNDGHVYGDSSNYETFTLSKLLARQFKSTYNNVQIKKQSAPLAASLFSFRG